MWICSTYLMYTPIWRLVFELGAGTSSIALGHASRLPLPPHLPGGVSLFSSNSSYVCPVVHYLFSATFHCVVTYCLMVRLLRMIYFVASLQGGQY